MSNMQKVKLTDVVSTLSLPIFGELKAMMALGHTGLDTFLFGESPTGLEFMELWVDLEKMMSSSVHDYWTNELYRFNSHEPYYALNLGVCVLYFKMSDTGQLIGKIVIRIPSRYARHPISDLAIDDPAPEYVFTIRDPEETFDVLMDSQKARDSLIAGTELHTCFCSFMDALEIKVIHNHARQTHAFEMGVIDLIANRFGPLSSENAPSRIQALVQILIDWNAKNPQTEIDPRAWSHLLVYAPEQAMRDTLEMKAKNRDS